MIDETTYNKLQDEWRTFRNNLDPLIVTTENGDILTWHYDADMYDGISSVKVETNNDILSYLLYVAKTAAYHLSVLNMEIIDEYKDSIDNIFEEYQRNNLLNQYDQYTAECICEDELYLNYITRIKDSDELKKAVMLLESSGYTVTKI